jgi:hypothetical protein
MFIRGSNSNILTLPLEWCKGGNGGIRPRASPSLVHPLTSEILTTGCSVKVAPRIANFLTRVVREIQATAWIRRQPTGGKPYKSQQSRSEAVLTAIPRCQIRRQKMGNISRFGFSNQTARISCRLI